MRHDITILTVNYNADDFIKLLIDSVHRYEKHDSIKTPIFVVENSDDPFKGHSGAISVINENNRDRTHGGGLNFGLSYVETEYVLVLDADCHILGPDWFFPFIREIQDHFMVTVPGSISKPIRPACMFMRTKDARLYDWRATPGYKGHRITPDGYDVGVKAYLEMVFEGKNIKFMEVHKPSRYLTANGEEYKLQDYNDIVYHHWHGTHLRQRQVDYPEVDLIADKKKLFGLIPWHKKSKIM